MMEKEICIIPLISFNGIEYGTSRKQLWEIFGKPKGSFKKTSSSIVETDDYEYFHIYYDENYNFEAVEIFKDVNINYNGKILPKQYSSVLNYFKELFDDIEEDECGFISNKGSIGVYYENENDIVDAILFGKEKYYD